MLDNNLILLIAIGIVVFLIMNLNTSKSEKKHYRSPKSYNDDFTESEENGYYEGFDQAPAPTTPAVNTVQTAVTSGQPVTAPGPVVAQIQSQLTDLYNSNLKGSPSPAGFASNITNVGYAADYGQGYNLGINTADPALAKFLSQAPPQKTPLISDDLLPKKSENWFETPSVGTRIDDANLLADAIFKTGVDTVGSTRKNPSYDMRGNIPNPKFPVSPWNNSSYEPDNNLRGLCI
ncbi:MAG: Cafeteria roenbergensis virus [Pseudomonadota bacterium]|jgi:hypothetical protein